MELNTSKPRGIIVVDASALFALDIEVNSAHRCKNGGLHAKPIKNYLEILEFLGRNGYQILIPEFVSLQAGQTLCGPSPDHPAHGKSLGDYFTVSPRPLRYINAKFISDAVHGKLPGISVIPAGDGEESWNCFLRDMHAIVARYPTKREGATTEIAALRRAYQGNDHRSHGFDSCLEVMLEQTGHCPIFFLSEDRHSHVRLNGFSESRPDLNLSSINVAGLIGGLCQQGLFENLGLASPNRHTIPAGLVPASKAVSDSLWDHRQYMFDMYLNNRLVTTRKTLMYHVTDGHLGEEGGGIKERHSWEFAKTLQALAAELPRSTPPVPEPEIVKVLPQMSAAERLQKKFGGDWRAKAGLDKNDGGSYGR